MGLNQDNSILSNAIKVSSTYNVGIGTAPNTWNALFKPIQLGSYGGYISGRTNENSLFLGTNHYFDSSTSQWIYTTTGGVSQMWFSGADIVFRNNVSGTAGNATAFTERMRLTSAGNVGIGTSSPEGPLHIYGTNAAGYVGMAIQNAVATTNTSCGIDFGVDASGLYNGTGNAQIKVINTNSSDNRSDMAFSTWSGSVFAERMRIRSGGAISIGAVSGSSGLLDIKPGAATSDGVILSATYTGSGSYGPFIFHTSDTERMRITSGGNVGIGTTPSAWASPFITIQGGTYGQHIGFQTNGPDMKIGTNHYYNGSAYVYTISGNGAAQLNIGGNSGFQFNVAPSGTAGNTVSFLNAMTITNAGDIQYAITATKDTRLIWVNSGSGQITSRIWADGNPATRVYTGTSTPTGVVLYDGATSWSSGSDIRLKNVTGNIENALEKLMQLNGVYFTWKTDEKAKSNVGIIAQDVLEVLPEVVTEDHISGMLHVAYQEMIPLVINAIKELKAEIDILKQQ